MVGETEKESNEGEEMSKASDALRDWREAVVAFQKSIENRPPIRAVSNGGTIAETHRNVQMADQFNALITRVFTDKNLQNAMRQYEAAGIFKSEIGEK